MRTGPGRPVTATPNASRTSSATLDESSICMACLVIGRANATRSISWNALRCLTDLLTWPTITYGLDYSAYMGDTMEAAGVTVSSVFHAAWDYPRVALYTTATAMFTVVAAMYPAWFVTRLRPVEALRHQ